MNGYEEQARNLRAAIAERLGPLGLELHPDKTRIVLCKDANRPGEAEHTSFTFLGYDFRGRSVLAKGRLFVGFNPAMSTSAITAKGKQIREWHLNRRSGAELSDLAEDINPQVRGWIGYYGAFYRSALSPLLQRINAYLMRWIRKKYKRLRGKKKARECWQGITERYPLMFAHWKWVPSVQRS